MEQFKAIYDNLLSPDHCNETDPPNGRLEQIGKCHEPKWLPWAKTGADGYNQIVIDGRSHVAHRVTLFANGHMPTEEAPFALHACNNRACCRLEHLRFGTTKENAGDRCADGNGSRQRGMDRGGSSGYHGVYQKTSTKKRIVSNPFKSMIREPMPDGVAGRGRLKTLGSFATPEAAAQAYNAAAVKFNADMDAADSKQARYPLNEGLPTDEPERVRAPNAFGQRNAARARTGEHGAGIQKRGNKFAVRVNVGGVRKWLGVFSTAEEATEARDAAILADTEKTL